MFTIILLGKIVTKRPVVYNVNKWKSREYYENISKFKRNF